MNGSRLVVAPARPIGREGEKRVVFETRRDRAGYRVGLAFTDIGALVRAMGDEQPWVCLPLGALKDFHAAAGVHRIVVDAVFQNPHQGEK